MIRGWANALRAGHVIEAANLFALPAVVPDGVHDAQRFSTSTRVREFNRGLAVRAHGSSTGGARRLVVIGHVRAPENARARRAMQRATAT